MIVGVHALTACTLHPTVSSPAPPFAIPEAYAGTAGDEAHVRPEEATPDRWWLAFGDPELSHLVELALSRNLELGAAWARLAQAEATVEGASAAHWPQISAQLDVSRRRQVSVFGALGRQEFEVNGFGVSVPASYELDLWNRVGHQVAAAGLDALATRDDVEALAITVAANVVEAWLDLVGQRALRRLLQIQLQANVAYEELVRRRYEHGL